MAAAERIDHHDYRSSVTQMPRVSEEDADELFRRLQSNTKRAAPEGLPSGWWVLAMAPLGLSAWVALGVWIFA